MDAPRARLTADPPKPSVSWAYRFEAWGAGLLFTIFGSLPLDAASGLAGMLARRIGPWLGVSNRARRNLRAALPQLSAAQVEAVLRGMWDNLGRVAAEYPHLRHIRVFGKASRVETRGLEHLDQALAGRRRVILFGGHLDNWEIAALAAGQHGLDIAQIYRAANNPLIDGMIARPRGGNGELIP